jgi:hypothetical protein
MQRTDLEFRLATTVKGDGICWMRGGNDVLMLLRGACIEVGEGPRPTVEGVRHSAGYSQIEHAGDVIKASCDIETPRVRFHLADTWRQIADDTWRVDRRLEVLSVRHTCGVRLILELVPTLTKRAYADFRYFAPPALYDLNDLNGDGIEDYLDTRSLHYREDRLNLLSILAYSESAHLSFSLSRADTPDFDSTPDRIPGQAAFLQRTDVGSLGFEPQDDGGVTLVAAYPFAERTRCNALLVTERSPFAAYWPADAGETLTASWLIRIHAEEDAHAALWSAWTRRFEELRPCAVTLAASLEEIEHHRIKSAESFFIEEKDPPFAAGFVTNCHPQDGKQLSNVIQFGFTGQNNLNAFNLLRGANRDSDIERRRKALAVMGFFVTIASRNTRGLIPGSYNADVREFGSWWTGLVLPLAYAKPGGDLEALMGPLYRHLHDVIEALADRQGIYLRCAVEEYSALLAAYRYELSRGVDHPEWLAACRVFAEFLLSVQQADGSWFRAYSPVGGAITDPRSWFGQTEVQQKSSTATPIPFLVTLHELTGDVRLVDGAQHAGDFVQRNFVERMKFNGGIHDSIYAKPQLVDGESMFAIQALLSLYRVSKDENHLRGAVRAARLVVTWICLWDVPLPPDSTLARFGFRSTGWMACDSPGAGYVHPMGILAVPDLVELGLISGDTRFLKAANLLQVGCNETVELPAKSWGYAMLGLQEEGLLVSWWFADDPMFADTAFGGRRKGEGNKTCLPWIAAVSVYAHQEMLARYGTTDISAIEEGSRFRGP